MNFNNIDNNNNPFLTKIGDKDYYLKMILFNDRGDVMPLNKNALRQIIINDNIFNPFHSAEMYISNDMGVIERSDFAFTFLGNGRDFLVFECMPDIGVPNGYEDEKLREKYMLKFYFVVSSCMEVQIQNSTVKHLQLIEVSQFLLNEKSSLLNSVDVLIDQGAEISSLINATNAARSAKTGDLITNILKQGITNDIVFESMDKGAESLFVNSAGNITYNDLLNYVRVYHKGEKNYDFCILSQDRYKKSFSNIPISEIFQKHMQNVIETFVFSGVGKDVNQNKLTWSISPIIYAESQIINFNIEKPAGKHTIEHFINANYMSTAKQFKTLIMDLKTGNMNNLLNIYKSMFVLPFKDLFAGHELDVNVFLNNDRKQGNVYVDVRGAEPRDVSASLSNLNQVNSMLFLSDVYTFTLQGITSRQAGKFVDVYRADSATDEVTQYDKNNLGRHFITSVRHIISQDTYSNIVETVKPYIIK